MLHYFLEFGPCLQVYIDTELKILMIHIGVPLYHIIPIADLFFESYKLHFQRDIFSIVIHHYNECDELQNVVTILNHEEHATSHGEYHTSDGLNIQLLAIAIARPLFYMNNFMKNNSNIHFFNIFYKH